MINEIQNFIKTFREKIYNFLPSRRDAAFELIDALSSNTSAKSVTELSLNPLHRRNYASITRSIGEYYSHQNKIDTTLQNQKLTNLLAESCPEKQTRHYHLFATDCTPNPRVFSETLFDRGIVHAPNPILNNKPITIGHEYSVVTYLPEKLSSEAPAWVIPLSCHRVATHEKGTMIGMKQIHDCIHSNESFKIQLCVSVGDCAYSSPECLAEAKKNANQVHITRLRNNRKLNYTFLQTQKTNKRGRIKYYGDILNFKDEKTWRTPDEICTIQSKNKKGLVQTIKIESWDSILMRGHRDAIIVDYPFRLLRICVYTFSGELLFKRPLWLIATGSRRGELSLQDIFFSYRQRFDIEHFFRFGKDKLLMNKIQTPDVSHEEAWWQFVMMAYGQLYLAREIANNTIKPWEKYLPTLKSPEQEKSPTQVQRDFSRIIQEIGTPAKPPKPRKKALGRSLGELQLKRPRYEVVVKGKKIENRAYNTT